MTEKMAKLEKKLGEAQAKNKTMGDLKKKFKELTRKLIRQQRHKSTRGSSKSKTFDDYSKRHQKSLPKKNGRRL